MHIGKRIAEELHKQGKSVVWLASAMSYSRANLYKIFARKSIDTDVLMRISKLLEFDFFSLYSENLQQSE